MDNSRLERLLERRRLMGALLSAVQNGQEHPAYACLDALQQEQERLHEEKTTAERQNDCIALNVLLCSAAERGGAPILRCDELYHRTGKAIRKLRGWESCRRLQHRMVRSYCRLTEQKQLRSVSPLIRQTVSYIDRDLSGDLTLKTMASRLSVNASYLSTLFRREMGMPLTEYVNGRRMEYAQKLLSDTEVPVKSIAHQCGFADVCYFSRVFKRCTGEPPGAFRNRTRSAQRHSFKKI